MRRLGGTEDELSRMGQRALEAQPFGALVGARLARLVDGEAVLEVPIRNELPQQDGLVHGGVIGYPDDNAPTFAGGSVLGPAVLTSEYKINYLRPASGETLAVQAAVVHAGGRQAVCHCDVFAVGSAAARSAVTVCTPTFAWDVILARPWFSHPSAALSRFATLVTCL